MSQLLILLWIIDTGANAHITGSASILHETKSLANSMRSIRLPNGARIPINQKVGSVALSVELQLSNVLDLMTGKTMRIGKARGGLYHLDINSFQSPHSKFVVPKSAQFSL